MRKIQTQIIKMTKSQYCQLKRLIKRRVGKKDITQDTEIQMMIKHKTKKMKKSLNMNLLRK